MRALVLGAYGAVGTLVVGELLSCGVDVLAAGRDQRLLDVLPASARKVHLDIRDQRAYQQAATRADVVVNCSGLEDVDLARGALLAGASFTDISATTRYLDQLEALHELAQRARRTVLLDVGLTPGLTNLLVADLPRPRGRVEITVLLGVGDAHGAAARAWTFNQLGHDFPDTTGAAPRVRSFTAPRLVELPDFGWRRAYRVDFPEQHVLSRELGVPVVHRLCFDIRLAGPVLTALTRVPGAARLLTRLDRYLPHRLPGSDRWVAQAWCDGNARRASGRSQSLATALVAAAATMRLGSTVPGAWHLHEVSRLGELSHRLAVGGVTLSAGCSPVVSVPGG